MTDLKNYTLQSPLVLDGETLHGFQVGANGTTRIQLLDNGMVRLERGGTPGEPEMSNGVPARPTIYFGPGWAGTEAERPAQGNRNEQERRR